MSWSTPSISPTTSWTTFRSGACMGSSDLAVPDSATSAATPRVNSASASRRRAWYPATSTCTRALWPPAKCWVAGAHDFLERPQRHAFRTDEDPEALTLDPDLDVVLLDIAPHRGGKAHRAHELVGELLRMVGLRRHGLGFHVRLLLAIGHGPGRLLRCRAVVRSTAAAPAAAPAPAAAARTGAFAVLGARRAFRRPRRLRDAAPASIPIRPIPTAGRDRPLPRRRRSVGLSLDKGFTRARIRASARPRPNRPPLGSSRISNSSSSSTTPRRSSASSLASSTLRAVTSIQSIVSASVSSCCGARSATVDSVPAWRRRCRHPAARRPCALASPADAFPAAVSSYILLSTKCCWPIRQQLETRKYRVVAAFRP